MATILKYGKLGQVLFAKHVVVDTIERFLMFCKPVEELWNQMLYWCTICIKVIFRLDTYEIPFVIPNDENCFCYLLQY